MNTKKHVNPLIPSIIALLTLLLISSAPTQPALAETSSTIVVNTLSGSSTSSLCSLHDAIWAANDDARRNGCSAGSGADTITFSVEGTIPRKLALIIRSDLTIDGGGKIKIESTLSSRHFEINSGKTVTLDGLALTKNSDRQFSGGINNLGTLYIRNSTIRGNYAEYGGGIRNQGSIAITNSTISDNEANLGGAGISNSGPAIISNSTFSGNITDKGGAIWNSHNSLTVVNSTFSDNEATWGGGILNDGTANIMNSTFSGNKGIGSSINNDSGQIVHLYNSIMVNNPAEDNCNNDGTYIVKHSLASDNTCGSADVEIATKINLAPLANNGCVTKHATGSGEACIQTHALSAGSVAIDSGDNTVCNNAEIDNFDQRGYARFGNTNACDIGAYEYQATPPPTNFQIVTHSGECLTIEGFSSENLAQIVAIECENDQTTRFNMVKEANTRGFSLQAPHSGKCLDIPFSSTSDATELVQWPCSQNDNQTFYWEGNQIKIEHSDKCLDIGSATLSQNTCDPNKLSQQFSIKQEFNVYIPIVVR